MSPVERRYSQIERESLGIYFAIERFKTFLYGMKFKVITDHKPLVTLFSNSANPPPRIARWVMRLMPYDFTVQYQAGIHNSADFLSRSNPLPTVASHNIAEEYIHFITANSLPVAITLADIQAGIQADSNLSTLRTQLQSDSFPTTGPYARFQASRHNFSIYNDIVLFNYKIVIPKQLQDTVITLAHEGHQGIVRTKERLRSKV